MISKGQFEDYMNLLKDSYGPNNLNDLMCRNQLSIDWQFLIYDCDFNQMLAMNLNSPQGNHPLHVSEITSNDLSDLPILTADHCYGCTAGQGSNLAARSTSDLTTRWFDKPADYSPGHLV